MGLTKADVAFNDQVDNDWQAYRHHARIILVRPPSTPSAHPALQVVEIRDNTANAKGPIGNPHVGRFRSRYRGISPMPSTQVIRPKHGT